MRKLFRIFAVVLTAICSLACSKDTTFTEEKPSGITPLSVTATLSSDDDTRISMADKGDGSMKQYWVESDVIYVINSREAGEQPAYAFAIDPASISKDRKSASFTAPDGYEGIPVYAIHRHTPPTSIDPTAYTYNYYNLPSPILADLFPLYGTYDPTTQDFAFKPLTAILRFDLTLPDEMDITNSAFVIKIRGLDLTYSVSIDITGQEPVYTHKFGHPIFSYSYPNSDYGQRYRMFVPAFPTQEFVDEVFIIEVIPAIIHEDYSIELKMGMTCTATQIGGGISAGKCHSITKTADDWTIHTFSWIGDGTGTAEDPYIITTEEQLRWLADYTNTNTFNSILLSDCYFELGNDITITTTETSPWMPIGGKDSFDNNFDGKGHTIKAAGGTLHLSHSGLFSNVDNISNLTLEANIICTINKSGDDTFGSIVGSAGTITNCRHIGKIEINEPYKLSSIGGIVGSAGAITNCHNIGGIEINGEPCNWSSIGGIVGSVSGGTITNCHNIGGIDITNVTDNGGFYAIGGIAGETHYKVEVRNCTQSGGEILDSNWDHIFSSIGGIVGRSGWESVLISGCSNSTDITIKMIDDYSTIIGDYGGESVGGIVGECAANLRIHNSTNSGDIRINAPNANIEQSYAGGIMGNDPPNYNALNDLIIYDCSSSTGKMYLNDAEVNPIPNVGSKPDFVLTECNTPHTAR